MQGFLNLNKSAGLTSHDCVARIRKLLKQRRIGHGGTLDPAVTGVLPIALGRATRLLQYLSRDKLYRATLRFGMETTTDDLEGDILAAEWAAELTLEQVKTALAQFQGKIQQVPPAYSAVRVGGRRLYDMARRGELVEVPPRTVEIYQIDVLNWRSGEFPEIDLLIACGTGTYIRAIARDLGKSLGTGGVLASLVRTASSGFTLADSVTLEELAEQIQAQTFRPIPADRGILHLPSMTISGRKAERWCQGQRIPLAEDELPAEAGICRVYDQADQFLGMGQAVLGDVSILAPQLVFRPGDDS